MKWCSSKNESESRSVVSHSLQPHEDNPWNSLGQNTRVGILSLLQGIFSTQGLNPGLWYCRQILYQLSHKGSPRILQWVAYPFGSSRPRNQSRFFTNWAIREALDSNENESEVTQSSPTLCDPMDCSPPGFSVHGIFQARILEWVAM